MPRPPADTPIADSLGPRLDRLAARRYPAPRPAGAAGPGPVSTYACDVRALARASGLAWTAVYRVLDGTRDPRFRTLERLCNACGATVADLYGEL